MKNNKTDNGTVQNIHCTSILELFNSVDFFTKENEFCSSESSGYTSKDIP